LQEKTGKQVLWWILEVKRANVSYTGCLVDKYYRKSSKSIKQLGKEEMTADKTCMVCQYLMQQRSPTLCNRSSRLCRWFGYSCFKE
jgi:hypothetical protein